MWMRFPGMDVHDEGNMLERFVLAEDGCGASRRIFMDDQYAAM